MSYHERCTAANEWFAKPRFGGITRLYSARDVADQQGTLDGECTVAREAAAAFHARLRELFDQRQQITTFGPYSPGQAVAMKRVGLEGIYLGGWATSAKGSISEDPGPDLASYPLNQVPDEAAPLVRALLTADRNQAFARSRMTIEQRRTTPEIDYRPFVIADADTGHGGDAHVRNLIRRFVEVGVPGYHIEDQRPGAKKCGHQAGKVLVGQDEQIKRLNAARFQLDVMRVPGIIVARTDAEAATLLDNRSDERDQPFILGATHLDLPSYRVGLLALLRTLVERGSEDVHGHRLFSVSELEYRAALDWLERAGLFSVLDETLSTLKSDGSAADVDRLDALDKHYTQVWEAAAGLKTYGEAVADVMRPRIEQGERFELSLEQWLAFSKRASWYEARAVARRIGIDLPWDCELSKTVDGFYQIQGGIDFAIVRSIAAAPFADLLWMETKTADLGDARRFAEAIHARYPDKMLAYNLSPSFNWDTTGMSDEEMKRFPQELGKLGFVFNFITYGGHQIDGMIAEEFATALKQDGMLALARLQRHFRLVESPYRTPQTLVGGPRMDAALMASSGRTAATKAMGKGSTQHQHFVQTEVPPAMLGQWLELWTALYVSTRKMRVELRPDTAGSDLLSLRVLDQESGEKLAGVVFAPTQDRLGHSILSIRDQMTAAPLRSKRLMTLMQLFLIHRYKAEVVHYLSPTDDNTRQAQRLRNLGIFIDVSAESAKIIVAEINRERIAELLAPDRKALNALILKTSESLVEVAG